MSNMSPFVIGVLFSSRRHIRENVLPTLRVIYVSLFLYFSLAQIRNTLPDVPVMCLTATATQRVRQDILKNMQLRNPVIEQGSFDRPNLSYSVKRKSGKAVSDIGKILNLRMGNRGTQRVDGFTIIYCPSKKETESIAQSLCGLGVPCAAYHAGSHFGNQFLKAIVGTSEHDPLLNFVPIEAGFMPRSVRPFME